MLDFIMMTLSIAGGILLAMGVMLVIMLQPCVIKWYTKLTMKSFESMFDVTNEKEEAKDL